MKPFRVLPALVLALVSLSAFGLGGFVGCSSDTPKAGLGDKCEESAQCDTPSGLVCRCVRRKAADEEGPEQILALGTCQKPDYKCPLADAGPIETGSDVGTDTTPIDGASDAPPEVATEAGDASDAAESSTDADPDGG